MTQKTRIVRIFLSSPGDVADERQKARRVILDLRKPFPGVTFQPVLWEELPLTATASFQESIDFLLNQQPIDIAIFIMWSRLGSPIGSEIARADGTPYRSGTEREFDLMLRAFEKSGKQRPILLAYAREDLAGFRRTLTESAPDKLEEIIAQRKLAESFIREQFFDDAGHNIRAFHSYREPVSFAQRLRTHLQTVLTDLLGVEVAAKWDDEPYRGLQPFDLEHTAIFQGREEETCDLLQRLREQQQSGCAFVVIVGASGSGKSSLARAGVAATLVEHAYDDGVQQCRVVPFIPSLASGELCEALAKTLLLQLPEVNPSVVSPADVAAGLARDPRTTVKLSILPGCIQAAERARGPVQLLLLLDQMEELWTDCRITSEERSRFMAAIEALARSGSIAVVATLRSDFYLHAQCEPCFLQLKGDRGHFDLLPPGPSALARLILEPARLAGIGFERDERSGRSLDQVILQDAARDPSALPLVQYALSELYRALDPERRILTFAAYKALGGVEGALGTRAAEAFSQLPTEARAALPEILPLLVTIDIAVEEAAVRRRAPLDELTATRARRQLVESLIATRFLVTDLQDKTPVASFAHEALLGRWPQLVEWLATNREQLRRRARVEQAQLRWEQQRRDASLLLAQGLALEEARQLLVDKAELLSSDTVAFIRTSITHDEAERLRVRRRRRKVIRALSAITLVALIATVIALRMYEKANLTAQEANRQAADALWQIATAARDRNQGVLAAHYFLRSAVASELAGDDLAKSNAALASQFASASLVRSFVHDSPIERIRLTSDARRMVTGDAGGMVKLWDLDCPTPLQEWKQGAPVLGVAFSSNESQVLVWSDEEKGQFKISLYDIDTTAPVRIWKHDLEVNQAKFIRNNTRVLTWCGRHGFNGNERHPGDVTLWDVSQPNPVRTWKQQARVRKIAITHDESEVLAWGDDGTVALYDVDQDAPKQIWKHEESAVGAAFSRDASYVLSWSGSSDGTFETRGEVNLWDVNQSTPLKSWSHDGSVHGAVFSRDESRILAWSGDQARTGAIALYDVKQDKPLQVWKQDSQVNGAVFSQDESLVLAWSGDLNTDGKVTLYDVTQAQPRKQWPFDSWIIGAKFLNKENGVLAWNVEGAAGIWRVTEGEPTGEFRMTARTADALRKQSGAGNSRKWTGGGATLTQDESRLLTWSDHYRAVARAALWDVSSAQPLHIWPHDSLIHKTMFLNDDSKILVCNYDGTLRIWDVSRTEPDGAWLSPHVFDLEFMEDEQRFLTRSEPYIYANSGYSHEVSLWSVSQSDRIQRWTHSEYVNGMIVARNQSQVIAWSADGVVALYDVNKPQAIQRWKHDRSVSGAKLSPDERRLVTWTGCKDPLEPSPSPGDVTLWDVDSPELIKKWPQSATVNGVEFSRDGSRILTWSGDTWWSNEDSSSGGEIQLLPASKAAPIQTWRPGTDVEGATFVQGESRVLAWGRRGVVILYDVTKSEPLQVWKAPSSQNERADNAARIKIWNAVIASSGKDPRSLTGLWKYIWLCRDAAFTQDASRVLSWRDLGIVTLHQMTPPNTSKTWKHGCNLDGAVFSRDGTRLLIWDGDAKLHLWDAVNAVPLRIWSHDNSVSGAAFCREDSAVLSWGGDGLLQLWDVGRNQPIHTWRHDSSIQNARFMRDGRRVIAWDDLGQIKLWNLAAQDPKMTPAERLFEIEARTATTLNTTGQAENLKSAEWRDRLHKIHTLENGSVKFDTGPTP